MSIQQTRTAFIPVLGIVALSYVLLAGHSWARATQPPNAAQAPPAKQEAIDEKTIRGLITQLGDDSFDNREAAAKRLADIGEPALKLLQKVGKESKDPEVRERAQQLIERITKSFFVEVRRFSSPFNQDKRWINRVAATPDGQMVLASGFGSLRSWDLATGKEAVVFEWPDVARYSWSLTLSADGKRVLVGSDDYVARLFDMKSGKLVTKFVGHTGSIWGTALLADGKSAVTGAWDQSLRVWDIASGKEIRKFENVQGNVRCLAVSPNGKFLAAGHFVQNGPGTLRLWEPETGKEIRALEGHAKEITSISFSPDGKSVLSSGFDTTIRLWDVTGGKEPRSFLGHRGRVESAAFTPNGERVVSCGNQEDPTLRLWDVASGTLLYQTAPVPEGFTHVAVLADGHRCVSAGRDGVVRLWQWKR